MKDNLTEAEKELFLKLQKTQVPPARLEKNLLAQLQKEGLINEIDNTKSIQMNNYIKWVASLAASILIFIGGVYYGKSTAIETDQVVIKPQMGYMLLLHEDQSFEPGDPMAMFQEYSRWMENTWNRGVKITGQELKNEATIVRGEESYPKDQGANRTTGYFILEANSYEEALAVAKDNPHIKYGGTIEVKPYMNR